MKKGALRIAQLHWGFPPIVGGVETHLATMLPEMSAKGHKVSLLTGSVEGVKGDYTDKGVRIMRTPLMDLNWLFKRGLEGLEGEVETVFKRFLKEVKPDIVHAHNMHYFSKIHGEILQNLSRKYAAPLILTAHNSWDDILFVELTTQIKWSHIIAVSHYIKKELMGVGCGEHRITVIHHGVDTLKYTPNLDTKAIFKKYPILRNKRIIFHPARIGLAKGCDVSIKAINIVKKKFPNVALIMAGSKNIIDWGLSQQKDIAYFVNLIKIFNLKRNVLIDVYTLKEMAQLYALSQVCIYPSTACEPFGLTMLEALSSERPMIVTRSGGMTEIIQDGINGFVVPIKDFETLAYRIIQLLNNDELRLRMGKTGRQFVLTHYTKEMLVNNTISVYQKMLQR